MTRYFKNPAGVVVALLFALLLSACGPSFEDLPLPGDDVAGDTIELNLEFDEALSLAKGAVVKVNGVEAGKVLDIEVRDYRAVALSRVRRDVEIRKSATARLRYTTPLGELFVDVTNPESGPALADGATLPARQTGTAPTVEDTLAQASLLINGGGISNIATINKELNLALGGREDLIKDFIGTSNEFLGQANQTTGDISRTLDELNKFSKQLDSRKKTIRAAVRQIEPAAKVIRQNTPGITALLKKLKQFAKVANRVVGKTRRSILQVLEMIGPILDEFLDNTYRTGPTLAALSTLGSTVKKVIPADYANLFVHVKLTPPPEDRQPTSSGGASPFTAADADQLVNNLQSGNTTGSRSKLALGGLLGEEAR